MTVLYSFSCEREGNITLLLIFILSTCRGPTLEQVLFSRADSKNLYSMASWDSRLPSVVNQLLLTNFRLKLSSTFRGSSWEIRGLFDSTALVLKKYLIVRLNLS